MRTITLSAVECRVILSALHSALAGDPSIGDYCWTAGEERAARAAVGKLTPDPAARTTTKSKARQPAEDDPREG